jgi:hypothetical protein
MNRPHEFKAAKNGKQRFMAVLKVRDIPLRV